MQYLLSVEEYKELANKGPKARKEVKAKLQKVCTMACDNIILAEIWGRPFNEPWGCILTKDDKGNHDEYCDECPVQEECPCEHKEWSK